MLNITILTYTFNNITYTKKIPFQRASIKKINMNKYIHQYWVIFIK